MKTSNLIVAAAAALIVVGGGAWWYLSQGTPAPEGATVTNGNTGPDYTPPADTGTPAPAQTIAVSYSSSAGFSPKTVTVKKGDTVTFTATDGSAMWVASDVHPSHAEYDGTTRQEHCAAGAAPSFDQCSAGTTYSFIFDKAGSFSFHNHVSSQNTGVVVVQ